jgi:DNA polymerase (family 10)
LLACGLVSAPLRGGELVLGLGQLRLELLPPGTPALVAPTRLLRPARRTPSAPARHCQTLERGEPAGLELVDQRPANEGVARLVPAHGCSQKIVHAPSHRLARRLPAREAGDRDFGQEPERLLQLGRGAFEFLRLARELRLSHALRSSSGVARGSRPVASSPIHRENDGRGLLELGDGASVVVSTRLFQLSCDAVPLRDEFLRRHREQPLPFGRQCSGGMGGGHDGNWTRMGRPDISNTEIADRLSLFAALLELAETNPFAVRAYERAADLVRATPAPVAELVRSGRVRELRGIGPGIESKLRELVATGEIAELRALEEETAPELVGFGRLLGLTAPRVLAIARALDVRTVAEFTQAVDEGRLTSVPGVGPAIESNIRAALDRKPEAQRGLTLNRSRPLAQAIADELGGEVAGPPRRFCELANELAVVCAADDPRPVLAYFEDLPAIVSVLERSERRAVGVTLDGVPVTLVVATVRTFGTELFRATGSPGYVEALEPLPDASDEEALFARLGLPYCVPELRETPSASPPPDLVEATDIRGDLHCHTTWSDGRASIRDMALTARSRGYEYLAICDHTPNVGVVHGLGSEELARQAEEIAEVNAELQPFGVLRGVECDIRADGALDVEDRMLAELDWVQLSLHAGQRRAAPELTRMVTSAMRHPAVRALSHPKGRILNHRPENALDLDAVFAVALETDVALEVNGLPDRLDLSAEHVREALAAGVALVLNSDAHSERGLGSLELALATARKGGATRSSVVNCRSLEKLLPKER